MSNKSKGVHLKNYMRTLKVIRLRKLGYTWGRIAKIVKMDRSNARRDAMKLK